MQLLQTSDIMFSAVRAQLLRPLKLVRRMKQFPTLEEP